jgi:hypothetical protein
MTEQGLSEITKMIAQIMQVKMDIDPTLRATNQDDWLEYEIDGKKLTYSQLTTTQRTEILNQYNEALAKLLQMEKDIFKKMEGKINNAIEGS